MSLRRHHFSWGHPFHWGHSCIVSQFNCDKGSGTVKFSYSGDSCRCHTYFPLVQWIGLQYFVLCMIVGFFFNTNYDDSDYDEFDDNYYHDYENNMIMGVITMRIMILMMTIEKTKMMVMMIMVSDHLPSPREFLPTRTERIFRNVWFPRSSSPW